MTVKVAVVAHSGKSFGGGLSELRAILERRGIDRLRWREVPKSRKAPKQVRKALDWGAELIFVWGGDGMAQRTIDAAAGSDTPLALLPAGTANLLASNLGVPQDIEAAVDIGLEGERRRLDIGRINGEAFAVMAGAGLDALMIADADGGLKDRLGRLGYIWTGLKNVRATPFDATITIEGTRWFKGTATCVLVGNVGELFGGVELFEGSRADDGLLEVGVLTATGVLETVRTVARVAVGSADDAALARTTKAASVRVKMDRKVLYEVDGGDRTKVKSLRVDVEPSAIVVCVKGPEQR
ncbi:MAG: diacylglycerol kinase family protein [Thermoleophilia bacterium]